MSKEKKSFIDDFMKDRKSTTNLAKLKCVKAYNLDNKITDPYKKLPDAQALSTIEATLSSLDPTQLMGMDLSEAKEYLARFKSATEELNPFIKAAKQIIDELNKFFEKLSEEKIFADRTDHYSIDNWNNPVKINLNIKPALSAGSFIEVGHVDRSSDNVLSVPWNIEGQGIEPDDRVLCDLSKFLNEEMGDIFLLEYRLALTQSALRKYVEDLEKQDLS